MAINNVNAANFAVLRSGTSGTTGTMDFSGSVVKGAGLDLVTPTSIANSGGSASASGGAVTFSGVTSVSLNGCFSTAYDNYRIVMRHVGDTTGDVNMRVRVSGSDASASNYDTQVILADASTVLGGQASTTSFLVTYTNTTNGTCEILIASPFLASPTTVLTQGHRGGARISQHCGRHSLSTSYDGFTLLGGGGVSTITGILRVYGYRNS